MQKVPEQNAPNRSPSPLGERVIDELLAQAPRLGLGAGLFAAILASGSFDPGPDLARALAVYLIRIALVVFLLSYVSKALHRKYDAYWSHRLLLARGSLDLTVALVFGLHLLAVYVYLHATRVWPSPLSLLGPGLGALALVARPWLAARHGQLAERIHAAAGDVAWLVFAGFYLRIVLGTTSGKLTGAPVALGWLAVLLVAFTLRVYGARPAAR